jgi:hypothetical protein
MEELREKAKEALRANFYYDKNLTGFENYTKFQEYTIRLIDSIFDEIDKYRNK